MTTNTESKIDNLSNKLSDIIQKKSQEQIKIENLEQKINKIENFISNKSSIKSSNSSYFGYANKALDNFVRSGKLENSDYFCKSLNSSENSGGALIKNDLYSQIIKAISEKSVIRNLASIENISGSFLEIVKENGEFSSGWVDEQEARDVTENSTLVKQKIFLHELYAQPKTTQKLIEDSEIDLETWIKDNIVNSFIKLENQAFIHGDGNKKPFGILHYQNDPEIHNIEITNDINTDSLLSMINSLKESFLTNAHFLVNRITLSKIQSLKDNNGRFIWQHSLSDSFAQTIFGIPVICCSHMPDVQRNQLPIILADFKSAYKIVDKSEISLVRDPYTEKPFIKFYTVKRVGGDIVNKKALVFGKII
ncbi:MAG: phage major capsid protein [Rickettsia sp.]|nr:phage major capsid protein [Rickettsia sp.]